MKIKFIYTLLFVFAFSTFLMAQEDSRGISDFTVGTTKVIFQQSSKDVVNVKLFIKGGTANYTKEKEGVESLMLKLMTEGGSKSYPKDEFFKALNKMGSTITASTTYDYGYIELSCIRKNFEESWKIFASAITEPFFSKEELDLIKDRALSAAAQTEADPDSKLRTLAMQNSFPGGNYAKISEGSEESILDISIDDITSHYKKVITGMNTFIVISGKLTKDEIFSGIKSDLVFPNGSRPLPFTGFTEVSNNSSEVNPESRDIATNYMRGYMSAPKAGTEESVAMKLAMDILRNKLWTEIRTKRNLSYAPSAFYPSSIVNSPYAAVYVSTDKPNESAQVIIDEIKKLRTDGFTEEELKNKKGQFLTRHFMRQETSSDQTLTLGIAEMGVGGWKRSLTFLDDVNSLSTEELNTVFNKYATAINWTYLGDETIIDKQVFTQEIASEKEIKEVVKAEKEGWFARWKKRRANKTKKTFSN